MFHMAIWSPCGWNFLGSIYYIWFCPFVGFVSFSWLVALVFSLVGSVACCGVVCRRYGVLMCFVCGVWCPMGYLLRGVVYWLSRLGRFVAWLPSRVSWKTASLPWNGPGRAQLRPLRTSAYGSLAMQILVFRIIQIVSRHHVFPRWPPLNSQCWSGIPCMF